MSAPTKKVRDIVYQRDNHRCVSCGSIINLTFQHRRAVGMGGSKIPPTPDEGLTACMICNAGFEADMQDVALLNGWKVRKFTRVWPSMIPVWYRIEGAWYKLNRDGSRDFLTDGEAAEYRELAGIGGSL